MDHDSFSGGTVPVTFDLLKEALDSMNANALKRRLHVLSPSQVRWIENTITSLRASGHDRDADAIENLVQHTCVIVGAYT